MIPLAVVAIALGVGGARIEEMRLVTVGSRLGIQLRVSGTPGRVMVQREGTVARVSLEDTALGGPFSGGDRFEWVPASTASHLPPGSGSLEAVGILRSRGEVSLYFRVPVQTAIEVRRGPSVVILVFHDPSVPAVAPLARNESALAVELGGLSGPPRPPTVVASASEQTPPPPLEAPTAEPPPPAAPPGRLLEPDARSEALRSAGAGFTPAEAELDGRGRARTGDLEAPPKLTPEERTELLRRLFPPTPPTEKASGSIPLPATTVTAEQSAEQTRVASADELYRRLFPLAPPETQEPPAVKAETSAGPAGPRTLTLGFLTLRPSLRMSYIKGEATLESAQPVSADYFQVQPALELTTTFSEGRLTLGYEPYIRAFSSHDVLEEPTHRLAAWLDLPVGTRVTFKATDTFMSGVLETQEVDPGYEYFYGLSRFRRNTIGVNGSLEVTPRLSIEAGGVLNAVRFDQPVGFFSYDSRSALLGLGYELTSSLKAILGYVYDRVPPPELRPVAEATGHSAQVTVSGDVTPLLTGRLTLGYRDQTSPRAPESGRHFRGVTASGSVTRALGTASWLALSVSRATPVSNFERNAFYVSTHADASLVLPLPFALSLESGIGHRWNEYRTDALELGRPRADRILGGRVALRRVFGPVASFAIGYRRDRRHSNLPQFDSATNVLIVQLDFNVFSAGGYR
jgi:hypothetical protein